MDAELEVQRTIKRAELTAFLCLLTKVIGPIKVRVGNKGITDGLWRGERKCIDPKVGDADLWMKIWEELQLLTSKEILVDAEHVKAHRTEKDKKDMSHFEKIATDGREKTNELAKAGAMLDEGFMAQTRAKTVQQEREEVYAAFQYAASFRCLVEEWKDCEELKPQPEEKWTFVDKKRDENTASNGMVWCCQQVPMSEMWKREQVHEDARTMCRAEIFGNFFLGNGESNMWERTRYGKKNG